MVSTIQKNYFTKLNIKKRCIPRVLDMAATTPTGLSVMLGRLTGAVCATDCTRVRTRTEDGVGTIRGTGKGAAASTTSGETPTRTSQPATTIITTQGTKLTKNKIAWWRKKHGLEFSERKCRNNFIRLLDLRKNHQLPTLVSNMCTWYMLIVERT